MAFLASKAFPFSTSRENLRRRLVDFTQEGCPTSVDIETWIFDLLDASRGLVYGLILLGKAEKGSSPDIYTSIGVFYSFPRRWLSPEIILQAAQQEASLKKVIGKDLAG